MKYNYKYNRIMYILGIVIGLQCNQYAKFRDKQQVHRANYQSNKIY